MANNFVVMLDIKLDSDPDLEGYVPTMGSDGNIHYYRFIGGSDGSGNVRVEVNAKKPATVVIVLADEAAYSIEAIKIQGDLHGQFSHSHPFKLLKSRAKKPLRGKIEDKNKLEASAKYSVFVMSSHKATFVCDPMIKNVPPG